MIPKPLPFMRIGLANLPLMLALDIFPFGSFLVLIGIKIFGQALITGTLFSYVFLLSLAGAFFSALLMYFLRRLLGQEKISFIGIGCAGAMASSAAQLMLAHIFIFRESIRYIAPPFLAAGLVTGIALGVFCEAFIRRQKTAGVKNEVIEKITEKKQTLSDNMFSAKALCITGLVIMPAFVFNPSTELRVLQFLFFWFLTFLSGRKTKSVFVITAFILIVAFNLLIPYGRILFSIGPLKITSGALAAGIHRAATFQGLIMLSKLCIREDLRLPGAFGKLLGESLRIFSVMMDRKKLITRKNLFASLDNMIMELSASEIPDYLTKSQRTSFLGFAILVIVAVLSWLPWLKIIC
jgi:heptaprenyl diphosphate synthase